MRRATLPLLGLAPGGVCRAARVTPGAGARLPHRFTLTCAVLRGARPSAVCSLWHFPAGHPDWALPSTLPCGVRTFLGRVTVAGLPGGHPSMRPTWGHWAGRPSHAWPCSGWGLPSRPGHPGRWCALTAPFHPCLCLPVARPAIGGLFSVALSCGSPRLAVSQHPALWSPDLPRRSRAAPRPPGRGSVQRPRAPGWPSICAVHLGRSAGPALPRSTLLRVGFAEPPGSPRALVRSYRTVSPLPVRPPAGAGTRHRRSVLCGTFLRVAPTGR
jgi:hypothetical protein